ncbi:MAG TPA: ribbon-helix-helix domain-containing protein [Candidatus Desulfofervidus auxilii]|uniref:Ribbon-helix-helix domain-containing protein n=1 Tax=Desulfofervidus auxilii TaxID=1621989 RepID=A0A7C0Y3M6_DESA2|nr:ribbon-helix-helix domain-containing protein [Candidatus Desulfofervidus auxilii]
MKYQKHSNKKITTISINLETYNKLKDYSKKTKKSISLIINEVLEGFNPQHSLNIQELSKKLNIPEFLIVKAILFALSDLKTNKKSEFKEFLKFFKKWIKQSKD